MMKCRVAPKENRTDSKMFELKRKALLSLLIPAVSAPRSQRLFVVASNHVGCEYGDAVDGVHTVVDNRSKGGS